MIKMPGKSLAGPIPALEPEEIALRDSLKQDVERLAGTIGERNLFRYEALRAAEGFIEQALARYGYEVRRQDYEIAGRACSNIEVEIRAANRADEIVIVGAHYDSVIGSPGANDNATGVAAMLALARAFSGKAVSRTLRFVGFVNEEPPFFQTQAMGSRVYSRRCRAKGERIVAMLSIETIGFYSQAKASQAYPFPFGLFYPSTGNFVGFVGSFSSRGLVREVVGSFRRHGRFPSEGAAVPAFIPGVGWSDHSSFWEEGYQALMVTDTAPFRYPYYHSPEDTPDKLHYDHLARVVAGLQAAVVDLAQR